MLTISPVPVASDGLPLKPNQDLSHLPGPKGHWLRGNLPSLLPNPGPYLLDLQREHGNCFTVGLLRNSRVLVWIGPQANETVLLDRERNFSARMGWQVLWDYFGANVLTRDFEDHRVHRQTMTPLFKAGAMHRHCNDMQRIIDSSLAQLSGPIDVYRLTKRIALDIAVQVFAGFSPGPTTDALYWDLKQVLDSVMAPRVRIPGTLHWQGMRARSRLRSALNDELQRRRKGTRQDMFSRLALHEDGDGRRLSDADVIDHMLGLLIAAHDTTASTLAMMLGLLATHPEWQQALTDEARELHDETGADTLRHDDLQKLEKTEWVFRETLRLYSPIQLLPRRNVRPLSVEGYEIPSNTQILLPVQGCHLNPAFFDSPTKFRPERFAQGAALEPYTLVPFGGGPHMCLGMHFALMEVRLIIYSLLNRYTLSVPGNGLPPIDYLPIIRPQGPMWLDFTPA